MFLGMWLAYEEKTVHMAQWMFGKMKEIRNGKVISEELDLKNPVMFFVSFVNSLGMH